MLLPAAQQPSTTVGPPPHKGQIEAKPLELKFRTFTRDLRRLRDWLKECGVSEVVMESTGQYWRPVWNVLEEQMPRLILVNPQHVKASPVERQIELIADVWRVTWNGRIGGQFYSASAHSELRDLSRGRIHLVEEVNRVKNRISSLCETGNIKISSVATDLFGASGRRMLQSVSEGKRDADWMADYAQGRLRQKRQSWRWPWRELFRMSAMDVARSDGAFEVVEKEMVMDSRRRSASQWAYEGQIQNLITIPGVDRIVAWTIIAELDRYERISGCEACAQLGWNLPWQSRERGQADERVARGRQTRSCGGIRARRHGRRVIPRNLFGGAVPEVYGSARPQQGNHGRGPPDSNRRLPNAAQG